MTGKTINTTITHAVTISSSYASPLTITSTGAIEPGAYSGTALYVPLKATVVTIVNHGQIDAATGASGVYVGNAGYNAVGLYSGTTLNNTGTIRGGVGGASDTLAGAGGIGINVQAAATIVNSGIVAGGAGGYGYTSYGSGGAGGLGISLGTAATLTNSGTIAGGRAGYDYQSGGGAGGTAVDGSAEAYVHNTGLMYGGGGGGGLGTAASYMSNAGDGVVLAAGGSLNNGGEILGGYAGFNAHAEEGGDGGLGVYLTQSTGQNTNLIEGGSGGYGKYDGGSGGYGVDLFSHANFTNSASVFGGEGGEGRVAGGSGAIGALVESGSTLTNSGHISGGSGGASYGYYGRSGGGGIGVYVYNSKLINHGTITGGGGGVAYGQGNEHDTFGTFGAIGGYGVATGDFLDPDGSFTATNYGLIKGGTGGYIEGYGGNAGIGGGGAGIFGGSLVNHGTIIGGTGGSVADRAEQYGYGGVGGVGVVVYGHGQVTNSGTVVGGAGGTNEFYGATGGAGVLIKGATFIDSGVVRGGAGGVSQYIGAQGDAVYLSGSTAGTLVLDPGASLVGNIVAVTTAANVLEVAGSSSGTLGGIGTKFIGFSQISFASAATRAIEGSVTSFATIDGFAAHDTIVLDNYTTSLAETGFIDNFISLNSGGSYNYLDLHGATAKDYIFTDGGGKTTIAAVGTTAHTIGTNSEQIIQFGGTSNDSKITGTGLETVQNGGTAAHSTIAGGTLVLDIGASISGGISFSTVTGGKLIIDSTHMPTAIISGFITGDTIKLAGVVYNSNDTVTVATAGTVTIQTPGVNYKLDIAGATVGETDFHFGANSVLTRSATTMASMPFLSPKQALTLPAHDWFGLAERNMFEARMLPLDWHAAAGGFTDLAVPEQQLVQGIGHASLTISNDIRLDPLGAEHHAGALF